MVKTERTKEALARLLNMFESDNLPTAVARTVIKGDARPFDKWSLGNRLLMPRSGARVQAVAGS